MKSKILNFLLIITSLFGYLEWGVTRHMFLFQVEAEIFSKLLTHPTSVIHPFTILPLLGQFLLLFTLFQKEPNKKLIYLGITCIGILLLLMLFIGIISLNFKIFLSTIPFIVVAILTVLYHKKNHKKTLP